MFRGFINDAKSAAGSVVDRQAARASVVVPFLIATGFATAGTALTLIEHVSQRDAYLILAGGFSAIGLLTALVVRSKEQEAVVAEKRAAKAEAAQVHTVSDTASVAATVAAELPLALIGALLTSTTGPVSVASVARTVGRNLPLVALLAGIGFLLWPQSVSEEVEIAGGDRGTAPDAIRPNGVDPAAGRREAA